MSDLRVWADGHSYFVCGDADKVLEWDGIVFVIHRLDSDKGGACGSSFEFPCVESEPEWSVCEDYRLFLRRSEDPDFARMKQIYSAIFG